MISNILQIDYNFRVYRGNESACVFAGVGGSVEGVKPEREEMVEINDDIGSEEAEKRVGSSKKSLGENTII